MLGKTAAQQKASPEAPGESQEKCYSGLKLALLGRAHEQQFKHKKIHLQGRLQKSSATPLQRR